MIGVDLSQWNSTSDFKKAKANGLKFAILRAGSGVTYIDSKFESSYKNAKAAGLPVGAYWYLYAMNIAQAEREADLFIARCKGKTFEYPVWLDFEDPSQNSLSKTLKTQMAIAFMVKLEQAGFYTGLYTMGSWFSRDFNFDYRYKGKTLRDFDKWVAHWTYSTSKKSSYVDGNTGIWQYSDKGTFPGIGNAGGNALDFNIAYRDYPNIIKNASLNGFVKPTQPKPPTIEEKPQVMPNSRKFVTYNNSVDKVQAERLHTQLGLIPVDLNSPNDLTQDDYVVHIGGGVNKYPDIVLKGGDRMDTDTKVTRFIESNK